MAESAAAVAATWPGLMSEWCAPGWRPGCGSKLGENLEKFKLHRHLYNNTFSHDYVERLKGSEFISIWLLSRTKHATTRRKKKFQITSFFSLSFSLLLYNNVCLLWVWISGSDGCASKYKKTSPREEEEKKIVASSWMSGNVLNFLIFFFFFSWWWKGVVF